MGGFDALPVGNQTPIPFNMEFPDTITITITAKRVMNEAPHSLLANVEQPKPITSVTFLNDGTMELALPENPMYAAYRATHQQIWNGFVIAIDRADLTIPAHQ